MTQPAYRFLEDVPNVSATGAMSDLNIHIGGTEPIAAPFNANNMIVLAVLANHEARLNSIDTIVSGTVSADETIFESFTSDFVNYTQVISDIKGSIFNWYDTLTSSGYSNYELYHRNTFASGVTITGALEVGGECNFASNVYLSGALRTYTNYFCLSGMTATDTVEFRSGTIIGNSVSVNPSTFNAITADKSTWFLPDDVGGEWVVSGSWGFAPDVVLYTIESDETVQDNVGDHFFFIVSGSWTSTQFTIRYAIASGTSSNNTNFRCHYMVMDTA